MAAIDDHCARVREWLNFEYSDELIKDWTKMAEEGISERLRCKHMIQIDTGSITENRVLLPSDWLELDFVRLVDGAPLHFMSRDNFYGGVYDVDGHYTITGNYLIVGNGADGLDVELSYYQEIPSLELGENWLYRQYRRVYIAATLAVATAYSIEDDRAAMWETALATFIEGMNTNQKIAQSSGSTINRTRRRSFG